MIKFCPKCDRDLPAEQFAKNASRPDGRAGWCKPCARASIKQWKQTNPQLVAEHNKIYYENRKLRLKGLDRG